MTTNNETPMASDVVVLDRTERLCRLRDNIEAALTLSRPIRTNFEYQQTRAGSSP